MDLFKKFQRDLVGYDTLGSIRRSLRKSGIMNRVARRRLKNANKFYEGYEEFLEQNRKDVENDRRFTE